MDTAFRSESGRAQVHAAYLSLRRASGLPLEELRVQTSQGETFVLACGARAAPPVVLLHGGATTSAMWLRSLEVWSREFRVYAIDMIGEPGLSAPSRPDLTTDAHAQWLEEVWQRLSIDRAALVGASQGGWLALDFAIRRPGRVAQLVLLAPAGFGALRAAYLFQVVPRAMLGLLGSRAAMRSAIRRAMGISAQQYAADTGGFVSFFELTQQHFRQRTRPLPVFTDAQLREVTAPVMAMLGGRDIIFDSGHTKLRLERCLPQTQIHFLPDAGHALGDSTMEVLDFISQMN